MISWQAVRGGGGKQAFYFQVTHRGESGVGGMGESGRAGDSDSTGGLNI